MKKPYIILTAIAIFAAVGIALAFKANPDCDMFCADPINGICNVPRFNIQPTLPFFGTTAHCTTSPTPLTTTCPTIKITACNP